MSAKELPVRKKNRLRGYDYSKKGMYFVTICVNGRHNLFGEIVGAASCRPQLTDMGNIVENEIITLSNSYHDVAVDKYIVMPNHVHMIVYIKDDESVRIGGRQDAAPTVSRMIGQWKRAISIKLGFSPWQKSYHDHIIRDEAEYHKIWRYIDENPARWAEDDYYG